MSEADALALYAKGRARPAPGRTVFHLGHSLVGRNMPAMLSQLAEAGHVSHSQLGWGTSLKNHWNDDISGFEVENDHAAARRAKIAIDSGSYDALVLTEMVDVRDAIKYHQSSEYLFRWAERAKTANPAVELFLYESWPNTDDRDGWFERIEGDLAQHWENSILIPAVRALGEPIYIIPGGQSLSATIQAVMSHEKIDNVSGINDFFEVAPDGTQDTIHINDLGAYVIALTHYAVLYRADPRGLPYRLLRANGESAVAPGAAVAEIMQQAVWDTVSNYTLTGVSA